jgi:hypothetical protein
MRAVWLVDCITNGIFLESPEPRIFLLQDAPVKNYFCIGDYHPLPIFRLAVFAADLRRSKFVKFLF